MPRADSFLTLALTRANESSVWAREMAQQDRVLATKPAHLSLIPRPHTVEGENGLPQAVLSPPCRKEWMVVEHCQYEVC